MKTFSISYQLNNPYKDYTPFIEALKSYGNWWQVNQYNWIIGSENATATQINEHLRHFLFGEDKLFVARINSNVPLLPKSEWAGAGLLPNESNWLQNNM